MTEHLPDCPSGQRKWQRAEAPIYGAMCICRELSIAYERGLEVGYQRGLATGIDCAHVAAAGMLTDDPISAWDVAVKSCLEQIDGIPKPVATGYSPTATDNRP